MCSTPSKGDYGEYVDSKKRFTSAHAYTIKSFDKNKGIVEIVNPHDTRKSEKVSLEEFTKTFDRIFTAKI